MKLAVQIRTVWRAGTPPVLLKRGLRWGPRRVDAFAAAPEGRFQKLEHVLVVGGPARSPREL